MSALRLSDRATAFTRIRLVYRVNATGVGLSAARDAAADVLASWADERNVFIASNPTEPVRGGSPGSGVLGLIGALAGAEEYAFALDVRTISTLPVMTWDALVDAHRSWGLWNLYPRSYLTAELDHIELVTAGAGNNAGTAAQERSASDAADRSRADDATDPIAGLFKSLAAFLIVAAVIGLVVLYLRRRT